MLGTPVFGEFLPVFSAEPQVGWGASLNPMFKSGLKDIRGQVWALAGPLKDIERFVPKTLLHCLGGVPNVIVLLEGEPSPQSEVFSALEQVFIKGLSVLCSVLLFLDPY